MTEISTCFPCKPRHCLLLDKTSIGKPQKWGDDKISPTILLKSQDGLLWKYLLTVQWRLIFLETSKQNEKYLNWGCQSQKLTDYLDGSFTPTVCYNWVPAPTAICRKTKHGQMALCLNSLLSTSDLKAFAFAPLLSSQACVCFGVAWGTVPRQFHTHELSNRAQVLSFQHC